MKFFRDLKIALINLVIYLPLIFNDRDWDYSFLLVLIKTKLKRMYAFLKSKDAVAVHPKKELRVLARIISHIEHYEDIDKYTNYEHPDFEFEELPNGNYTKKPLSKLEAKKLMKNYKLEHDHLKQAFILLSKHITKFWD